MEYIITYYFNGNIFLIIFCFISVLYAIITYAIIYLYKRHKKKNFVPRYRIEEKIYKTDRNINGEVKKIYKCYVICQDTSPWVSWYLDFRIDNKVFIVTQYTRREYAERFYSKEKAENRINDMIANPDKYILDD